MVRDHEIYRRCRGLAMIASLATLGASLRPTTVVAKQAPRSVDRRHFGCAVVTALGVAIQAPALAAGEFEALRAELDGTSSGLTRLEQLLADEDYAEVIKFSKEYFIYVGKGIMTSARKDLADDNKAAAKDLYNRVQEDLIAINKLSRPKGQENKPEALRYLAALKNDMREFLALDPASR